MPAKKTFITQCGAFFCIFAPYFEIRKMKKFVILILSILLIYNIVQAQEVRCNISVNSTQLTNVNKEIFYTMQTDLYEFINNKKWTKHTYNQRERIECSFNIQITKMISSDEYDATLTVQSKRPVYNSSYTSTILNIKDEYFRFKYKEFQTIEFQDNDNKDNLTNVLAYYIYVILGFDYDTFSPQGGTEYFEKAREIVTNSQSATGRGWKAFESDYNRYWIVENMLNKSYAPYRQCLYRYHRLGLDAMSESVESGRSEAADALRDLQKVFRSKAKLYITQMFFDAKRSELTNIFSQSYSDEMNRVVNILTEIDPSNADQYQRMKESAESK